MSQWLASLASLIEQGSPSVLITIVDVKGSVPRGAGTKMIVTEHGLYFGTIGGGNLEYQCIDVAKQRLTLSGIANLADVDAAISTNPTELNAPSDPKDDLWLRNVQRFPLGARLGQCCGGVVVVLFEYIAAQRPDWLSDLLMYKASRVMVTLATPLYDPNKPKVIMPHHTLSEQSSEVVEPSPPSMEQYVGYLVETLAPNDFNISVFGAGHVGKALVHVLSGLECEVSWVDSRADEFPETIPANVTKMIEPNPEDVVEMAPTGSYFIVLTHSHHLDQKLCERILVRKDFRYCGLIGSRSKRAKFEHRFRVKGISEEQIAALTCPIGIPSLKGKQPGHIAVAVAAQLLTLQEAYL